MAEGDGSDSRKAATEAGEGVPAAVSEFWASFDQLGAEVRRIAEEIGGLDGPEAGDSSKRMLDAAQERLSQMQALVASASVVLPSFELKRSYQVQRDMQQMVENARCSAVPKKKFSFKARRQQRDPPSGSSHTAAAAAEAAAAVSQMPQAASASEARVDVLVDFGDQHRVSALSGCTVVLGQNEIGGRDLWLSSLKNCTVFAQSTMGALRIDHLEDCVVVAGPIHGSVHMDHCVGCTLYLCSHQIRIHHAQRCDFYLQVRSGPIIEHSSALRFGPWERQHCEQIGGSADAVASLWCDIKDFNWLRSQQSPNWSILPNEERQEPPRQPSQQ